MTKQGQATHSTRGGTKVEPKSHAVDPGCAANIGLAQGRHTSKTLYEGRGLTAPMKGVTNHPKGSQGNHR